MLLGKELAKICSVQLKAVKCACKGQFDNTSATLIMSAFQLFETLSVVSESSLVHRAASEIDSYRQWPAVPGAQQS